MLLNKIVSDGTVFLQGKFISMAIGQFGALGSYTRPTGEFKSSNLDDAAGLGMYVDLDGFGTGKASTLQDTVSMGAVIERFNIGYTIGGVKHVEGNMQYGASTILNSKSTDLSDATAAKAGWTGTTDEKLKVEQVMTLTDDAKYVKVEITLTNQSSVTMADLHYMRSVDPDQDASYKNLIKVIEQGGDGKDGALIAAYQPNGNNPFFYYTADDRAKVSTYNLINRDPYSDKANAGAQAEGYSVTADQAVNINFAAGNLAAGSSTKLVFYMGVTDNLSATLAEIKSIDDDVVLVPKPTPTPVDLAPIAVADEASTLNTKSVSGNVLTNDHDPEGKSLSAKLVSGPANGTVSLSADGSFVYTAKAGFAGTDAFTYAASDGNSSSNAKVTLTVTAPPPVAVGDAMTAVAGGTITGNVLANDKSGSGAALTSTLGTGPTHGTLKLAANGSFTYVADADFTGTDTFTYSASDGKASDTARVTINVSARPNTAPVAQNDSAGSVEAGSKLTGNVLANDRDADGDALIASLVNGPSHGTVTLSANGNYVYTAATGYSGSDSFSYSASDGKVSDTALVSIDVTAPPPVLTTLDKLLAAHNAVDGSDAASSVLTGRAGHNAFYFDVDAKTGKDTIGNLEGSDLLIFSKALVDGNGDGIITFSSNRLKVDGTTTGDMLNLTGVSSLRYMGVATEGAHVYAKGGVKPAGALESRISDDRLSGDLADLRTQKFFFDTALGLDLGHDTVVNMGKRDIVVTTSALADGDRDGIIRAGTDGQFDLASPNGDLSDAGHFGMFNTAGGAISAIEFDGSVIRNGVTYYVYSLEGSTAGLPTLGF